MEAYNEKLVIAGDILEYFKYQKGVIKKTDVEKAYLKELRENGEIPPILKKKATEAEKIIKARYEAMKRSQREIRRIVNANRTNFDMFMTLTYGENEQDIKKAYYEWKCFKQRLEDKYKQKFKYVGVIEFQNRGAIHFHVILFNAPYIPFWEIEKIWGLGRCDYKECFDIDNLGAYLTYYLTKDLCPEDDRLRGQKIYFTSKGLQRAEEITDKKQIQAILQAQTKKPVYETEFYNDIRGYVKYQQFNNRREEK